MLVTPTENDPTLWTTLLGLVPVLAGAVIAVVGTLAGARYSTHLDEQRQRISRKREKLESLVQATYALDMWLDKERDHMFWNGPQNDTPNPIAVIDTITLLHLPGLRTYSNELHGQVIKYRQWLLEGLKQKVASNPQQVPRAHIDTFESATTPYATKRAELLKAALEAMRELD
jgi:hypothetical protein